MKESFLLKHTGSKSRFKGNIFESECSRLELIKIKSWLLEGIPFRMTGPGTEPEKARHHLNCRETERAVDKIAQFCAQGHMAGPLHSRKTRNDLKFTSIFARYQQSDNSVRIINDHSYPKGRAFNEAIDSKVVEEIPIHVGQLREFIKSVLECGKNAIISKYDMNAAYKFIPVKRKQFICRENGDQKM